MCQKECARNYERHDGRHSAECYKLKVYKRENYKSLRKLCFLLSEANSSIGISVPCLHIHPDLHTCSPARCTQFLSTLIFDSLLLCLVVFTRAHSEYDFEAERCQQEAYSKEEHMKRIVGVVQTITFLMSKESHCV